MARRENELYIGNEFLTIEGRSIKHPALTRWYATVNANKIAKNPVQVKALDLETNALTGELKLLGLWDGTQYAHYTDRFLQRLFSIIRQCKADEAAVAYWNRLDPFVLFKLFLLQLDLKQQHRALSRFGKISGEWDKEEGAWKMQPVCEVKIGDQYFGIRNAIRSSVQFFYYREGATNLNTVWAYDIAQLYPGGLEKEATKRFDYYSKVDKSAHIVDWDKFNSDYDYRENIVLKSNMLDARACHDLALAIQKDFKRAFGFYPRNLISQGSLARAAIVAQLYQHHLEDHADEKELTKKIGQEIKSIGLRNYKDNWVEQIGEKGYKDMESLFTEAYSGGYIEAIRYGYAKTGWYADIASAYPGEIVNLYDLRGADIKTGVGDPPKPTAGYVFIRGTVNIPKDVNYHPVTIKHFVNKDTNIRATGEYRCSYTWDERVYLEKRGTTFSDERWFSLETEGKKSPLANVCMNFIEMRKKLQAKGDSSQYMAKIAANSLYGILFEAVDTYIEQEVEKEIEGQKDTFYKDALELYYKNINLKTDKREIKATFKDDYQKMMRRWHDRTSGNTIESVKQELEDRGVYINAVNKMDILDQLNKLYDMAKQRPSVQTYLDYEVERNGYRAGEFWNPLYAAIITARARVKMAEGADAIEAKGGKPIILMTDSLTWTGAKDLLPSHLWKKEKTLGYFEEPEAISDIVCLGSGRYGFKLGDQYVTKRRGLNAVDIHDPDGVPVDNFNWAKALEIMQRTKRTDIDIKVRTLISPGVVLHNKKYSAKDLGRIVENTKTYAAIVGKTKRFYDDSIKDPETLATQLVDTEPIWIPRGFNGQWQPIDQTLPLLRSKMMDMTLKTGKEKRQKTNRKSQKRYYQRHQETIRSNFKTKYRMLKSLGYTADKATLMANWSEKRLNLHLEEVKS